MNILISPTFINEIKFEEEPNLKIIENHLADSSLLVVNTKGRKQINIKVHNSTRNQPNHNVVEKQTANFGINGFDTFRIGN